MEWLNAVGLNKKQSLFYQYLLKTGASTASELAHDLGEQRTNIYLLADALINLGLVEKDDGHGVARFRATNPSRLQELMTARQKSLATSSSKMKQALPELLGLYYLNISQEGMAYFEGLKGYEAALDDMSKTKHEVCVFGATFLEEARPDAWSILMNKLHKRALARIKTRIIFEETRKSSKTLSVDRSSSLKKYMEARFWGKSPFEGEVTIYDSAVVLTSYDEKLVSLVIKNKAISETMQAIFNTAWQSADNNY